MRLGQIWITFVRWDVGADDDCWIVLFVVHGSLLRDLHVLTIQDLVHECDLMLAMEFVEDDEFVSVVQTVEEFFHASAVVSWKIS